MIVELARDTKVKRCHLSVDGVQTAQRFHQRAIVILRVRVGVDIHLCPYSTATLTQPINIETKPQSSFNESMACWCYCHISINEERSHPSAWLLSIVDQIVSRQDW
jgi:hypothetical protein